MTALHVLWPLLPLGGYRVTALCALSVLSPLGLAGETRVSRDCLPGAPTISSANMEAQRRGFGGLALMEDERENGR